MKMICESLKKQNIVTYVDWSFENEKLSLKIFGITVIVDNGRPLINRVIYHIKYLSFYQLSLTIYQDDSHFFIQRL